MNSTFWTNSQFTAEFTAGCEFDIFLNSQLTVEFTIVNSANSQLTAEFTIVYSGLSANSQLTTEFTTESLLAVNSTYLANYIQFLVIFAPNLNDAKIIYGPIYAVACSFDIQNRSHAKMNSFLLLIYFLCYSYGNYIFTKTSQSDLRHLTEFQYRWNPRSFYENLPTKPEKCFIDRMNRYNSKIHVCHMLF